MTVESFPTRCAICGTEANATERYPANYDSAAFSPETFSARRVPDRIHYRIVQCRGCGLVRSDPVADPAVVAGLYARSTFDYAQETRALQETYGRYLRSLGGNGAAHRSLLEIGCGNGFFLEEALRQGYRDVWGVEPSRHAVSRAAEEIRPKIVCDVLRPGLFPDERFDVIVMFQVLDHLSSPDSILLLSWRMLKPGGAILALNHNVEAWSARLLGERSPIIDIEHTFLYSPRTLRRLFEKCGFAVQRAGSVRNKYSIAYLAQLVPMPRSLKNRLLSGLDRNRVGRMRVSLPLGNLYLIARKPVQAGVQACDAVA